MTEVLETLDQLVHVGVMVGLNIIVWGCVTVGVVAVVVLCLKTIKGGW